MDVNESKKLLASSQSIQNVHMSMVNSKPNSKNINISDGVCHDTNDSDISNDGQNPILVSTFTENSISKPTSNDEDNSDREENSSVGRWFRSDSSIDDRLPDTVKLLKTPEGTKVYLIGTAHFSKESQDDVSMIIQAVQPSFIMIELCDSRVNILQLDERTMLEEVKNISFRTISRTISRNGVLNGFVYLLLLNLSAYFTQQLEMVPGGEFRRAFAEAKKIRNCIIHLGDRPIIITLKRALNLLTWKQTILLCWSLFNYREPISKEDVERCKRFDFIEEMLAEIAGEYPALERVLVYERDIYLTHSLQLATQSSQSMYGPEACIVGVVGIGHMSGIIKHWGKVTPSQIAPILEIPPPSMSSRILRITFRASVIGAICYVGYKYIPFPSMSTLNSIKSSIEGLVKVSV